MSKQQVQNMLRLMAGGGPVELTSPMASVKKLARLAFVAQQFGYEYADVRQGGSRGSALKMLIVPDPAPQARARAAQNWAQYPNVSDGVSLPPVVPDAFELLKARINFDLTGKNAEKRMGYGALGVTAGCAILGVRLGGTNTDFIAAAVTWVVLMGVFGIGFVVTRHRNAKFAARLQAAGFARVTDETGRVRYLPPGAMAGYGQSPYGGGFPAPAPAPGPYGAQYGGAYGTAAPTPAGGYGQQQPPQQPQPHAQPQPYAQPQPHAQPHQQPGPYGGQQPYPQPHPQPYPQPHPQPQAQQYPQRPPAPYPPQGPAPYGQQPPR
ncbi:hypothetical protein [Streptomyces sp. 3214.6]|uniref:hypothetical protein n=1 Tax=Streptomyces sp. 3214.6 TaxID=1882757 RepID=UPI0009A567E0|nr:hypothetical protein [Streptomyces sp. 3214.6]